MKINKSLAIILLMAGNCLILNAQIPSGGIRLNASSGTTYLKIGQCTITETQVSNQAFSTGLRIEVGSSLSNPWNAQVKFPAIEGIEKDDVILVAFYGRTISSTEETGEGAVSVVVENNSTYAKELSYNIKLGNEWKQYFARAVVTNPLSSNQVSYLFHIGFSDQVIEIADVRFLNYKQTITLEDLPETEITYPGQAPDANWRMPAAERIEQHRKGTMEFIVVDANGLTIEGATVKIEMLQHQFGFGTAIAANAVNDNSTYREKLLSNFNEVVFENDLKWPQFKVNNTAHISQAMDTMDAHNIPIRGHNVIWPSYRFLPDFVEGLGEDTIALKNTIDRHIDEVTQFTKGRLNDWDVINEAYSEHDLQDIMGNKVMAEWFKRVKRNDRNVKLYLNDYQIVSSGGTNTEKQDFYYDLVQYVDDLGGEVDGIGIQGHFGTDLTSINRVSEILDRFAQLGKDIKITEFDVNTTQRNVQADYTRDFLTLCFSQPAVKAVLVWGFWEGRHWKPDCAFYNQDWSIRPHGEIWRDLIYNQWWTPNTDLSTNAEGKAELTGFLGTYKYSIQQSEFTRTGTFSLDHSAESQLPNQLILSLDESFPEKVEIISSIEGYLCQGEETTLEANAGDGIEYSWFRDETPLDESGSSIKVSEPGTYYVSISKGSLSLSSEPYEVIVHDQPDAKFDATGGGILCEGDSVILSTEELEDTEYLWKRNNFQFAFGSNELVVKRSGSYSLELVSNGCADLSESLTINIGEQPDSEINFTGNLPLCEGESIYLLGTIASNISYSWYNNGIELESANRVLEVFDAGTYQLKTSIGECSSLSEEIEVSINPLPEASITVEGDLTFCEGGSVTLTANSGENISYLWKRNNSILDKTDQSITVNEEGEYTLNTIQENCSSESESVTVSLLSPDNTECNNSISENILEVKVAPNPFYNSFFLRIPGPVNDPVQYSLVNVLGKTVLKKDLIDTSIDIRVEVPEPGIYLLRLVSGNKSSSIRIIGL